MATLQDLIAQKEALERQIEEVSTQSRTEAIEKIKALMNDNNLTLADLGVRSSNGKPGNKPGSKSTTGRKPGALAGSKVAAKYKDGDSGNTWSGRGLQPKWLKAALASGKKIADFAV